MGAVVAVGSTTAVGTGVLVDSGAEDGESLEAQPKASTTATARAATSRSPDCILRRGFRGAMVTEVAFIIGSIA